MLELTVAAWVALIVGAFFAGLSKTALPGIVLITVVLYAALLPARESTAAVLILMLFGDLFAITAFRRYVKWRVLWQMVPFVLLGVIAGAMFLRFSDDGSVKKAIGVILLVLIVVTLWGRYGPGRSRAAKSGAAGTPVVSGAEVPRGPEGSRQSQRPSRAVALLQRAWYGTLGGFTTMTANLGSPVTSLYFLTLRLNVLWFLGTTAWFFFVVNLIKLPLSVSIGLFSAPLVWSMVAMLPVVTIGALVGKWLATRMSSKVFDPIVWVLTAAGAVALLVW